jgi:small GTP-binding protein
LRQALSWHSSRHAQLQPDLQNELDLLTAILNKLDQSVVRIAAFGLVSRGKSAILNALVGQKVFQTGPLHGVTQWPRSVRWSPTATASPNSAQPQASKVQVELIDTPGLDEVDGQVRAQMAREIAHQADLVLFVVAGDLTRTEYQALCELTEAQKPLILVFNKMDLYPDLDRQAIYKTLQNQRLRQLLSPNEIVMAAAEPAPLQVRVEWPDGRVTSEWETPPPQVDDLKQQLLCILNREGRSLLALNALFQMSQAETAIAQKVLELRQSQAQALIWRFVRFKSLAVALNPIAFLDLLGGACSDLIMIRSLAQLYGLPMTRFEAGKLWKTILLSSGGLLLSELGSSLALSISKSAATFTEGVGGITTYASAASIQAGAAGYGSYIIGQAAQAYLANGCTWGTFGPDTIIQDILNHLEPNMILGRIQQELQEKLRRT